jgi:hypothetical protein
MPPIAVIILFSTYIFPLLGSGPQWNTVVTPIKKLCRKNWWKTLLLIQNFYGFENICITHTHYVRFDCWVFYLFFSVIEIQIQSICFIQFLLMRHFIFVSIFIEHPLTSDFFKILMKITTIF